MSVVIAEAIMAMTSELKDFVERRRKNYDWIRQEFLKGLVQDGFVEQAKAVAKLSDRDFIVLCNNALKEYQKDA